MYRYSFKHLNTGTCSNYKFRKNLCFPIKYEQVTSHSLVLHNFNLYTCKHPLWQFVSSTFVYLSTLKLGLPMKH